MEVGKIVDITLDNCKEFVGKSVKILQAERKEGKSVKIVEKKDEKDKEKMPEKEKEESSNNKSAVEEPPKIGEKTSLIETDDKAEEEKKSEEKTSKEVDTVVGQDQTREESDVAKIAKEGETKKDGTVEASEEVAAKNKDDSHQSIEVEIKSGGKEDDVVGSTAAAADQCQKNEPGQKTCQPSEEDKPTTKEEEAGRKEGEKTLIVAETETSHHSDVAAADSASSADAALAAAKDPESTEEAKTFPEVATAETSPQPPPLEKPEETPGGKSLPNKKGLKDKKASVVAKGGKRAVKKPVSTLSSEEVAPDIAAEEIPKVSPNNDEGTVADSSTEGLPASSFDETAPEKKLDISELVDAISSTLDSLDEETQRVKGLIAGGDSTPPPSGELKKQQEEEEEEEETFQETTPSTTILRRKPMDPEVQESIRLLLESYQTKKRPEQLMASTSVMYSDVMNASRNRNTTRTLLRAAKIANAIY